MYYPGHITPNNVFPSGSPEILGAQGVNQLAIDTRKSSSNLAANNLAL